MRVHLVDGTYELFRHYFAVPSRKDRDGHEVGALVGVLRSVLGLLRDEASHVGIATDHTVESFRNDLYDGYKSGEGLEAELWEQFHPLEDALTAMGVRVWPMIELEADDGLAAAAERAARDDAVEQVLIASPDKDLAQCVRADRVVQLDRRKQEIRDEAGVWDRFGVAPASIPDWLALVGDTADGFPGLPRWGAKSASTVLARWSHLRHIPDDPSVWDVKVRGAVALGEILRDGREEADLYRTLATLRTDFPVFESVGELLWTGPTPDFPAVCERLGIPALARRADELAAALPG